MNTRIVGPELIESRLRGTGNQLSWMVFARDGVDTLVIGNPVISTSHHDILLATYAGILGERTMTGRRNLWGEVQAAGICNALGEITEWVDDIGLIEPPARFRPLIEATLYDVLPSRK